MNCLKISVKTFALLTAVTLAFSISANGQVQSSSLQDKDGNIYTIKTMPDNREWMTVNLNINIPQSYCYENAKQKCREYGRLYTWKSAQEGCKRLGEAWHLPTNEEWQQMAKWYGGVLDDSKDGGKAAYQALVKGGKAGFNVVYGGYCDSAGTIYSHGDAHGFYWTATQSDSTHAWFYNFGRNGKIMNRHNDGDKNMAISVRCLKGPMKSH